jgi:nicotinate phosphoribosyltransferase
MGMVYKLVAHTDDEGEWVSVAKKSTDKASVGGRKSARRLLDARGVARAELVFLGDGPGGDPEGAELSEQSREIMVPLISEGETQPGHTGEEGIAAARSRHCRVVAELPPVAMSLTRGDPAIPTEYR